jgi:hypothetical protein
MALPRLRTFLPLRCSLPRRCRPFAELSGEAVRFVVPFRRAGRSTLPRARSRSSFRSTWKQQAIVDNRAGAGGIVGAEHAAKSAADGYTCSSAASIIPYCRLALGPVVQHREGFRAVTFATASDHPRRASFGAGQVGQGAVAYAKANPGS